MARGWESKGVESQIDDRRQAAQASRPDPDDGDVELKRRKNSLLLDRTRISNDLKTTSNERYKQTLKAALAHLDAQIAKVDDELNH